MVDELLFGFLRPERGKDKRTDRMPSDPEESKKSIVTARQTDFQFHSPVFHVEGVELNATGPHVSLVGRAPPLMANTPVTVPVVYF
jgi:hypothetical protein